MFGFFSILPFSTVDTIYYNGIDSELILNIQQSDIHSPSIYSVIGIELTLEKNPQVIIWIFSALHYLFSNNPISYWEDNMASEIHVNDVGTKFLATIKDDGVVVDISSATSITIILKKPDDEIMQKTGTLDSDGTDGKVYYSTIAGDLDEAGLYKLQAKVILSTGTYYTDIYSFKVHCNL